MVVIKRSSWPPSNPPQPSKGIFWCYGWWFRNPAITSWYGMVVYPIIYKVLAPSQVVQDFLHQQNDGSLSHTKILSIMSCLSFRFVLDSVPVKNYHSITHSHPYDSLHHQSNWFDFPPTKNNNGPTGFPVGKHLCEPRCSHQSKLLWCPKWYSSSYGLVQKEINPGYSLEN